MVKPRQPRDSLRSEFAGGLLPGLTGPLAPKAPHHQSDEGTNPQGDESTNPPGDSSPNHQGTLDGAGGIPTRRKVAFYLDTPGHLDLIDELLGKLRRACDLPRDQSMLIQALLEQARPALTDPVRLQALADACSATLPNR